MKKLLLLLLILSICLNLFQWRNQAVKCENLDSYWKAELLYTLGHKHLDGDKDGIPCENLYPIILIVLMFGFIPKHSIDNSINSQLYQIQQDVSYIREYLEKRELKLSFYFPQKLNFDYILLT